MRRFVRWAAGVSLVLVVALVAASVYVVWTVRRSFPQVDGELELPGLSATVEVVRDEYGVPQVYADTAQDLFRAQGYVHAQDRFWEMDFRRHVTSGRLAELFGEDQVETDAFIRTMGWRRVAEQELAILQPATRRYLRAYADGVNEWMAEHTGAEMSLEHALLGLTNRDYAPEPWSPADSLAWLKAMAWDLRGNMEEEVDRTLLAEVLAPQRVEQLYPPYPYDRQQPIVAPAGAAARAALPAGVADALRGVSRASAELDALIGPSGTGVGSNAWAVSGERTASGRPLLANDPHLGPRVPGIWHQMGLHCRTVSDACPFEVTGFTFSGVPGVVIGHNADVAWGFTNLGPDVSDLYLESVEGDQYLTPDGMQPLRTRSETIRVAGGEDVEITVRASRNGPLVSDVSDTYRDLGRDADLSAADGEGAPPRGDAYAVALRWTALQPARTADALFLMARASDWTSFRAAARSFAVPSQNLVYADVDGNIGYQAPGLVPIRRSGDGRYPVPGWTDDYAWDGFIPFERMPSRLNPAEGQVVTANQAVVGPDFPYLLTTDWAYGYRSERIRDLLGDRGGLTAADMLAVQADAEHPAAPMLLPRLLAVTNLSSYRKVGQDELRRWDGQQTTDSRGAAYFNAVWRVLLRLTFHDELPEESWPDGGDRWVEVVRGLLERPDDPFWDDVATDRVEDRDTIIRAAMVQARDEMTQLVAKQPRDWSWGRMHTLELEHASFGTSGIGPVEWLFNRGPYETSGGTDAVLATSWDAAEGYDVTWVPSMRMVVDLSDLDRSRWVNLTGTSGHPFHPNYVDQVELWRDGRLTPMRWEERSIREAAEHTLVLRPADPAEGG